MCCMHAARWKCRTQKIAENSPSGHHAQLCRAISSQLKHVSTIGKSLLNSNVSPTCLHNIVHFGPLAAEICWRVWGTPANFNGLRILAVLLHGTVVLSLLFIMYIVHKVQNIRNTHIKHTTVADVSQTLQRWTQGATYVWQGGHHVGQTRNVDQCPHF